MVLTSPLISIESWEKEKKVFDSLDFLLISADLKAMSIQLEETKQSLQAANLERSSEKSHLSQQLMEAKESLRIADDETRLLKKRLQDAVEEKEKQVLSLLDSEEEMKKMKSSFIEEKEKLLREIKDVKADVRNFENIFAHSISPIERSDRRKLRLSKPSTSPCCETARRHKRTCKERTICKRS